MKTTDTLIEDIYDKLKPLTEEKPLAISDEEIDLFGEEIKKVFKSWAHPEPRNVGFSLRMSNIGKPVRQLWFDKHHPADNHITPSTFIKFLYGHMLEEVILVLARLSGHEVTDEQKEVKVDGIVGHMDCKIDGQVVDVKTASSFAYGKFAKGTLADDDPFGYLAQLAGYEAAENTEEGSFLVINKETGALCLHTPEDLDKPNIRAKIRDIKIALESLDPPEELCYPVVNEGAKGNQRLHKNCNYCPHKFKCFKDSNNGKGLRTFQYAKGLTHFTKVIATPKVEELYHDLGI